MRVSSLPPTLDSMLAMMLRMTQIEKRRSAKTSYPIMCVYTLEKAWYYRRPPNNSQCDISKLVQRLADFNTLESTLLFIFLRLRKYAALAKTRSNTSKVETERKFFRTAGRGAPSPLGAEAAQSNSAALIVSVTDVRTIDVKKHGVLHGDTQ
ncbi:hypothetical protein NDU88_007360 [Pleurodeles waltl]|uniref:Uncharacterized protein n=1 Tax=Pleurodeles waltl TaxID=8319 RepID=A0AAV7QLK7_PLEWA|nr:hypothetical protein NDU88_007360 [Pleurodeles waltl]